jgi:hypothetical protein
MRKAVSGALTLLAAAALTITGATGASAATIRPAACTGVIQITSLAFSPAAIAPGQSSTATLQARNCTGQTQQTTATWFGQFIGSSTGIPTGCAAVDPLPRPTTFAPFSAIAQSTSYLVFSSCTASALRITVQITGSGGTLLASASTSLTITH